MAGEHIESMTYIPWEDVKQFLRSGIHAVKHEIAFLKSRAQIEQQYADSLEKWSADLRDTLKNDTAFEYGEHRDVMWGLADEGTHRAKRHRKIYEGISNDDGFTKPLKELYGSVEPKRKFGLSPKKIRPNEEEYHRHHQLIFEGVLRDVLKCQDFAEKNTKLTKKIKALCDHLQDSKVSLKPHEKNLNSGSIETEILSMEAKSTCLMSSFTSMKRNVQDAMPMTLEKAEHFTANLIKQEVDRLTIVFKTLTEYLDVLKPDETEMEKYEEAIASVISQLSEISPTAVAEKWRERHTLEVVCPSDIDCKPEVEVRTSLRTTNKYTYGYKEEVVDLFKADRK